MIGFYEPRATSHGRCHEARVTRGNVFNLNLLPLSGIWIRGGLRTATGGPSAPNSMNDSSKNASEKITTLHNDFGIDLTQEGEGDLAIMCNLGEGIYEDGLMKGKQEGWKKGREEGRKEGKLELALELLKDGMSLEKVAKYSKLSLSMIKELAKQK